MFQVEADVPSAVMSSRKLNLALRLQQQEQQQQQQRQHEAARRLNEAKCKCGVWKL